jgi:hypothetical protein
MQVHVAVAESGSGKKASLGRSSQTKGSTWGGVAFLPSVWEQLELEQE